jgi:hypothetical protein
VCNAASSIIGAMRHRNHIGETLALSALARQLHQGGRGGVSKLQ